METASSTTREQIATMIADNSVVLFMKGNPQFPQCGFSAAAVKMLSEAGATNFAYVNVLEDSAIREGIKQYSSWPTIPQLYVNQEFIGGADILSEMHQSGELQTLLKA